MEKKLEQKVNDIFIRYSDERFTTLYLTEKDYHPSLFDTLQSLTNSP